MPFGRGPASQGTRAGGDETQAHGTKVACSLTEGPV